MPNYPATQARAEKAIAKSGASAIIRRPGPDTGDPWNPTQGSATDYPIKVLFTDYAQSERDGTLVKQTDKRAYVSTEGGITPTTSDDLVSEGVVYEIVSVNPLRPATVTLLFEVQVRS
jgi:hypothetical protein